MSLRGLDAEVNPPLVRVFGGVQVVYQGQPISIGGPRQRRLLALLTIRPGVLADNDWLVENLWSDRDRPDDGVPAIRTAISRLRMALPDATRDWLDTEESGYRWSGPPVAIEHRWFSEMRAVAAAAGEDADPGRAFDVLTRALACWRGEPFRELEDLDWSKPEIEQLRLDRLEAMEDRWGWALAVDRHTEIIGELAAFTAEHGLRDRAVRQYAVALQQSGRSAESLRVLARHRRLLADESGLDPSKDVDELERAILDGERPVVAETSLRRIRGYRLVEQAGSGAFAIVWRGYQPSVSREVAIKQVRSELASQPEFIRRFEAEAQLVARLEHPHIVPLIDFWREPGSAYLVTRWLSGGTLEQRLAAGPMSVVDTTRLIEQVGGALSAAHAQGVVHSDVSVGTVLLDTAGNAYLSDFGIALASTGAGGVGDIGPEFDVQSLGQVARACLTAPRPIPEPDGNTLSTSGGVVPDAGPDLPAFMAAAIDRATAADPAQRFRTVAEFVAALTASHIAGPGDKLDGNQSGTTSDSVVNPYKGLRAFLDADADDFFGRDSLVGELVEQLTPPTRGGDDPASRGLVVVGPSGSGKSSAARAGLLPALRSGAVPGSEQWFSTTMVPGPQPFEALEAALLRVAVNPPASLITQLRDGPRGFVRGVRRCLATDDDVLVLLIDQFEELFTSADEPGERLGFEFLTGLAAAIGEPGSPLRLVATLRADYYDRPLQHPAFAPVLKRSAVDITPLTPEELERVVVGPAERCGLAFEGGLVSRIVADSVGQPSPLPLLQYALSELFDRRSGNLITSADYESLGGLSGALTESAERLYRDAGVVEQNTIRRVFGQLLNPGETSGDLRRRVAVGDLGDEPAVVRFLGRFGRARLLTFDRDPATREPTVEVAHEALLREWSRLVDWIAEDRALLRAAADLGRAATIWDGSGRQQADLYRAGRLRSAVALADEAGDRLRPLDREFVDASAALAAAEHETEARRIRRLQGLVVGLGVTLLLMVGAGVVAYVSRGQAQEAAAEAEVSDLLGRSALERDDDPDVGLRLALEAYDRSPTNETERAVREALLNSPIAGRVARFPPLADIDGPCPWVTVPSKAAYEFAVIDGRLVTRDTSTGAVADHGRPPDPCVQWFGDFESNRRVALAEDGRAWFGTFDGDWVEQDFGGPVVGCFGATCEFNQSNRILLRTGDDGEDVGTVLVVDDTTGEPVGEPLGVGELVIAADLNASGSRAAVATLGQQSDDQAGSVIVTDTETGEQVLRLDQLASRSVAFDDRTDRLIIATGAGTVRTVDIDENSTLSEVESTILAQGDPLEVILGFGLAPGGSLVVITETRVEVISLEDEAPAVVTPIPRGGFGAGLRADGTFYRRSLDGSVEIYDLSANALVGRSIGLVAGFPIAVDDQVALVSTWNEDPRAERPGLSVRDLEGGTATAVDWTMGGLFPAMVAPDPGSASLADGSFVALAWDANDAYHVARWENGVIVERLALPPSAAGEESPVLEPSFDPAVEHLIVPVGVDRSTVEVTVVSLSAPTTAAGPYRSLAIRSQTNFPRDGLAHVMPRAGDGFHVLFVDGRLQTFTLDGEVVSEMRLDVDPGSGLEFVGPDGPSLDPATGDLLIPLPSGVLVVDTGEQEANLIGTEQQVIGVKALSAGSRLAMLLSDGSIRLWDLEQGESLGVVWRGQSLSSFANVEGDRSPDSVWVFDADRLVRLDLSPGNLIERACDLVRAESPATAGDRVEAATDLSICS